MNRLNAAELIPIANGISRIMCYDPIQTTEIQSSSINNNRLVFVYVRIKSADKISIGVINENNIGTLTTCGYDTYRGCIEYW
ncbi:hypothetical protein GJ496_006152 [Pomphorhynchus laevis]|nr:hypothetical protein GJ496_006152 [Pomphorhynchus laevis]